MAKLPKLPHVKYVRSKGKVYAYFNTGRKKGGQPVYARLPDPGSVGFFDSYSSFMGGRTKQAKVEWTVADLVEEYEASSDYAKKAKGTRNLYSMTGKRIVEALGEFPVNDLTRADVRTVLDTMQDRPGAHNVFVAVLGILYTWARDRDKTILRPTEGIKQLRVKAHEPWPDDVLHAGLEAKHDRTRLAVNLLYYTGQRIGDVVRIRWSDIKGGVLHLTQQKRGKFVEVRIHEALAEELAHTPKAGITILTNHQGAPISSEIVRRELQAFTAAMGHQTVPHGLRKNAVNALLEAGCTVAEVGAITGQSHRIVEYYARRVNTRKLASAAILKLENKGGIGKRFGKRASEGAE